MRFFLLALLVMAASACGDKPKSTIEPQDAGKRDPVKPKPDGEPDLFAVKTPHHKGFITEVRAARGSRFALAQVQLKKGEAPRSVLLERTARGETLERFGNDGLGEILAFDVNEEELCLLRSADTEVRDPVTNRKYVDLRVQCEGGASGQPLLFHDGGLAGGAKVYDKYGTAREYRAPVPGKTLFHRREYQRPFAQLRLLGREKILLVSGDFGERLYKIDKEGALAWGGQGREVRPLTEIFADNGAPRSTPRLAVAEGKIVVLGGFRAEELPILVEHYKNQRLLPPVAGHREGLLVSLWELDGKFAWQRPMSTAEALAPAAVSAGADGLTLLAHESESGSGSWIGRFGFDGGQKWARSLAGTKLMTRLNALAEGSEIYAAGSCRGGDTEDGAARSGSQACLLRFELPNGALVATREFGGAKDDGIFAIAPLEKGKFLIGGYVDGPVSRGSDPGAKAQSYAWGIW